MNFSLHLSCEELSSNQDTVCHVLLMIPALPQIITKQTNKNKQASTGVAPIAPKASAFFGPRMSMLASLFAVVYGVGLVVYPEAHTWLCFSVLVATGNWDPCWGSNT